MNSILNNPDLLENISNAIDYVDIDGNSCLLVKKDGHFLYCENVKVQTKVSFNGYVEAVSSATLIELFGEGHEVLDPNADAQVIIDWMKAQK